MNELIKKIEAEKINNNNCGTCNPEFVRGYSKALEWLLAELKNISCERCKWEDECPKRIYDDQSGNIYSLTSCSAFESKGEIK